MKRNTFVLKCFSQFTCTNLDGSQNKVPLEISCESKGEESINHNILVQNNLKASFEIMAKSFSSPCKPLQITAWAKRFIKNCCSQQKITDILTSSEITHGGSPPLPQILGGDLKISDQNNWGGPEQKIKFGGELNLSGDLKF